MLSGPYQYVSPYVKKADDMGDATLSKVDERFPVVKKPTGELRDNAQSMVSLPFRKGMEGKDHILSLYSSEYKKAGGEGLVSHAKGTVSTAFIVSTQTVMVVGNWLSAGKEEAKGTIQEKTNN